jgi:hypothetical protein
MQLEGGKGELWTMGTMDGGTKGLGCDGMAADFMLSISHP